MGKFVALTICSHVVLPFLNIMHSKKIGTKERSRTSYVGCFDATFPDLDFEEFPVPCVRVNLRFFTVNENGRH